VYAPGERSYHAIGLRIDAPEFVRAHETIYPESDIYDLKPLDEQVEVYQ